MVNNEKHCNLSPRGDYLTKFAPEMRFLDVICARDVHIFVCVFVRVLLSRRWVQFCSLNIVKERNIHCTTISHKMSRGSVTLTWGRLDLCWWERWKPFFTMALIRARAPMTSLSGPCGSIHRDEEPLHQALDTALSGIYDAAVRVCIPPLYNLFSTLRKILL